MTAIEKYHNTPTTQIQTDNLTIQVTIPWWTYIEISTITGRFTNDENPSGCSESRIFLNPKEVDILINQLQIAKDALIEHYIGKD